MSQNILTALNVQKKYGRQTVLRDISISIKEGEIYGLVGKNGSGKTTLFRILTGQLQTFCGTVSVMGNRKMSAIINSPSLFLNMNACDNMKAQSHLLGLRNDDKILQVLESVGLSAQDKKQAKNFSLGMTQRLKLGLALLADPDILILDEPANGLDPDGIVELRELLIGLNRTKGITILISSHILSELEQIVTRLGILHNGTIVKELSDNDVFQDGKNLEKLYMEYTKGGRQ